MGLHKGIGKSYTSMLTAASIPDAVCYYDLFKEVKAGKHKVKVDESVKSKIHDFPKVAITYSLSENKELSAQHQEKMKEALDDYNEMFNTNFTLETIKVYNNDLNNRLSRKHDRFLARKEQIDIVIVVNRLLTGFDAPCLSTLFIDRSPMQPHHLIQAFSRTNRLFDIDKRYGQIVTFRTPNMYKKTVDDSFYLYSKGGITSVLAPTWEEASTELYNAIKELMNIASAPSEIDDFNTLEEMKKFAKAFQSFDKAYASIQVYSDYNQDDFINKYNLTPEVIEEYKGKYQNVIEKIKEEIESADPNEVEFDIEYELQSVSKDTIDYAYIIMLMQTHVQNDHDPDPEKPVDTSEIDRVLDEFEKTRPELASIMKIIWKDLQTNREKYRNKNLSVIIGDYVNEHINHHINKFASELFVNEQNLQFVAEHYNPDKEDGKQVGESALLGSADYEAYKANTEKPLAKIKYRSKVRHGYKELIEKEVVPYRWDDL